MRQAISLLLVLCLSITGMAQHIFNARIQDAQTREALPGASVLLTGTNKGAHADATGRAFLQNIPDGRQSFRIQHVGYETQTIDLDYPRPDDTVTILLEPAGEEMDQVVISTRNSRSLRNIPTRVEIINSEELEEKANMRPGDIRMMLNETTGIQTQQISAASANSSIRIQGLDGRYTQILKDGFPLYAGFSGGLGLLQTPPLDLRQVEIVKGSSSTLYGGGAIAGLVNLISKVPTSERDLRFLINGTSAGGLDIDGYYGQQFDKIGLTLYASQNSSRAYAPSGVPFTAIPRTQRNVLQPKLFLTLGDHTKLIAGFSTTWENRLGGDARYLEGKDDSTHSYFERNKSRRLSTQFTLDHSFNEHNSLTIKNAFNKFNRTITIPGYVFDGRQWSSYSEITYRHQQDKMDWIAGVNVYTDDFSEFPKDSFPKRNYTQHTFGGFLQNTWKMASWLQAEAGIRGDYIADYGFAFLPRLSALFTLTPKLTSRVGGGLGYKTPTIFTEEAERIQFRSVRPISIDTNKLERSYGANFDINYKTRLWGKVNVNINQLFFFTWINAPLQLVAINPSLYHLVNVPGDMGTKGWETNIKFSYESFRWYIGYTYTHTHLRQGDKVIENPLTVKHRVNNILMYEVENKWKLGFEAYYYSRQLLTDGATGRPYWTLGFMAEKIWQHLSIFINFENFTDTRQTKFDTIYTGTVTHPVFRDIYAPLDGFVLNGGVKLRL